MNNNKKMDIREKSYYRFKKFTRFLKEKKLYGKFKKKGVFLIFSEKCFFKKKLCEKMLNF